MIDASTSVPPPVNEPVLTYAPGGAERAELELTLARMQGEKIELTQTIGGARSWGAAAASTSCSRTPDGTCSAA